MAKIIYFIIIRLLSSLFCLCPCYIITEDVAMKTKSVSFKNNWLLTELCTLIDQWIISKYTQQHQIQPTFGEFNWNHLDEDHISVTVMTLSYLLTSFVWCDGLSWSKSIMDHLWWMKETERRITELSINKSSALSITGSHHI